MKKLMMILFLFVGLFLQAQQTVPDVSGLYPGSQVTIRSMELISGNNYRLNVFVDGFSTSIILSFKPNEIIAWQCQGICQVNATSSGCHAPVAAAGGGWECPPCSGDGDCKLVMGIIYCYE
jgi:hypothetical protein